MSGFVEKRSRCNKANTANKLIVLFLEMCKHKKLDSKTGACKKTSIRFELKRRLLMKERLLYYMPAQAAKQAAKDGAGAA